ncbi:MAG: hypothetical protein LBG28_00205 [Tannerella sp.]|jgi:hypothetical protein|nr:hypothetical protein [Tannerella sp.]
MKKLICTVSFLIGIFFVEPSFVSAASLSVGQQERSSGFRDPFQTANESNSYSGQGGNSSESGELRNGIGEISTPIADNLYLVFILGAAYAVYCYRRGSVRRSNK